MRILGRNRQGFTLIELLVVVLIIGILAAVALPQYQKAVMKSRYATVKTLARSLADAEERYYLANSTYTNDIEELDIEFPQTPTSITSGATYKIYYFPWGLCSLQATDSEPRMGCSNALGNLAYNIQLPHVPANANAYTKQYAGKHRCKPNSTSGAQGALAQQVCKQETGKDADSGGDYWYD